MAEGGFVDENADLDLHLDHDDEDDDDDEQGVNLTWPSQPGSAFTPCHAGEKELRSICFLKNKVGCPKPL